MHKYTLSRVFILDFVGFCWAFTFSVFGMVISVYQNTTAANFYWIICYMVALSSNDFSVLSWNFKTGHSSLLYFFRRVSSHATYTQFFSAWICNILFRDSILCWNNANKIYLQFWYCSEMTLWAWANPIKFYRGTELTSRNKDITQNLHRFFLKKNYQF